MNYCQCNNRNVIYPESVEMRKYIMAEHTDNSKFLTSSIIEFNWLCYIYLRKIQHLIDKTWIARRYGFEIKSK